MVTPYARTKAIQAGRAGTVILIPVTNPIESVFATVRHRTVRTKGALSAKTAKLMVFKLVNAAAKTWRRLKGENQLPKVVQGVKFQNGIEVIKMSAHHAA
jgi:putative transposase